MTKSRERQLIEECEAGLHCCDAEQLIKQEKKQERSLEKRRQTIAKKAAENAFFTLQDQIAKLTSEVNSLQAQIAEKDDVINELKTKCKTFVAAGKAWKEKYQESEKKTLSLAIRANKAENDLAVKNGDVRDANDIDDADVKLAARKEKFWKVLAKHVYSMDISKRMACMMAETAHDINKKLLFKEPACGVSSIDLTRRDSLVIRKKLILKFQEIFSVEIANDETYCHNWEKMLMDTTREFYMYYPQTREQVATSIPAIQQVEHEKKLVEQKKLFEDRHDDEVKPAPEGLTNEQLFALID